MMTLAATSAHAVLSSLKAANARVLLEELDSVGADNEILERLLVRLKRASEQECELRYEYTLLFSWLVARVGPQLMESCEVIEAEIAKRDASGSVVAPRWVLAAPIVGALQRRVPCRPFVIDDEADVARAYDGLLDHLVFVAALPPNDRQLEMLNTAIPWRIIAIADRLEPAAGFDEKKEGIKVRLQRLRGRTISGSSISPVEKRWWSSLNDDLCARRHSLSHVCERDGWTFSQCVDECWSIDEARAATAGIGLAVLDRIARSLRDMAPPAEVLDAVLNDSTTSWLDD